MLDRLATWGMRAVYAAGGLAGIALSLLYTLQNKIIYVPFIPGIPPEEYNVSPEEYGFEYEDVELTASDGVRLHAWLLWQPEWGHASLRTRPLLMFFQENAGSMSFRLPMLRQLAVRLGTPIFALSYRGYGRSSGSPTEAGLMRDAVAAMEHVLKRSDINSSNVVLYGRSLGGAVATHLAARYQQQLRGAMIENTFTCLEDMAGRMFPPLRFLIGRGRPANFLLRNKWANYREVERLTATPVLFIGSVHDEMVPFEHMQELYETYVRARGANHKGTWLELPNASHMDGYAVDKEIFWGGVRSWWQANVGPLQL